LSHTSTLSVAVVNYLNAKPFVKGLSTYPQFHITLDLPHVCADLYNQDSVDIALVPVGTLPILNPYRIITDYCIGCHGAVKTVCIFSHCPLDTCKTVYLDNHSRTSALLAKMLLQDYMGLNPQYIQAEVAHLDLDQDEAVLMIGDKVFPVEHDFEYKYDLGELWLQWTGLPFAFAVWVARPSVHHDQIKALNAALAVGLGSIDHKPTNDDILGHYYAENISYPFDKLKKQALDLYLDRALPFL
jgi:chorismate dehydratase